MALFLCVSVTLRVASGQHRSQFWTTTMAKNIKTMVKTKMGRSNIEEALALAERAALF
jgi:hypothetical protein